MAAGWQLVCRRGARVLHPSTGSSMRLLFLAPTTTAAGQPHAIADAVVDGSPLLLCLAVAAAATTAPGTSPPPKSITTRLQGTGMLTCGTSATWLTSTARLAWSFWLSPATRRGLWGGVGWGRLLCAVLPLCFPVARQRAELAGWHLLGWRVEPSPLCVHACAPASAAVCIPGARRASRHPRIHAGPALQVSGRHEPCDGSCALPSSCPWLPEPWLPVCPSACPSPSPSPSPSAPPTHGCWPPALLPLPVPGPRGLVMEKCEVKTGSRHEHPVFQFLKVGGASGEPGQCRCCAALP